MLTHHLDIDCALPVSGIKIARNQKRSAACSGMQISVVVSSTPYFSKTLKKWGRLLKNYCCKIQATNFLIKFTIYQASQATNCWYHVRLKANILRKALSYD